MSTKLNSEQLRKTYDPESLAEEFPSKHRPLKAIIGQDRAIRALQFGLGNKASGFNVYVSGYPGEGKLDAVKHFLEDLARQGRPPKDWCYVNNFQDPYCPKMLELKQGQAKVFKTDIKNFVEEATKTLIKAFESEEFAGKQNEISKVFQQKEQEFLRGLDEKAKQENFIIRRTPVEMVVLPLVDGRPMTDKEFYALSNEEKEKILEKQQEFREEIKSIVRQAREQGRKYSAAIYDLERGVALFTLDPLLDELHAKYKDQEEILKYLEDIKNDILDNLSQFLERQNEDGQNPTKKAYLNKYEVNLLVDNSQVEGAPIVLELNPTYNNLFGKIEKESLMGTLATDFTLIRGGSLHKANGGYLILEVEDLLRDFFSWDSIKRALKNQRIDIEDIGERLGFISTKSLKPDPIPLNVQIILIGRLRYYYLLYELDDDFRDLFKVKADFDMSMEPSQENLKDFIAFVHNLCEEKKLLPPDKTCLAATMEFAHRLAEHQRRISNRFGEISDLILEANYYALEEKNPTISARHIRRAIEERIYRSNLLQEKIDEYIEQGVIMIDLEGERTGQINGLSVIDLGDISFGRPTRISASVSVGQSGIIDIEREAKLGGPIHTKGVLILSGYLANTFGQDMPLSLSAQLVFEQSYSEIEGDSASSAELYAILSALAGLPIRQSIAVTGSVNQKGEVQAVGGINEKVEGFFDICRRKELTGNQGVIIPRSNVQNLMLKEEVVEAVDNDLFHIWAVSTIDEGLKILTGVKAGKTIKDKKTGGVGFEKGSVKDRVYKRLVEIRKKVSAFDKKEEA
jgi:lon-related putative ATP-dependent protease